VPLDVTACRSCVSGAGLIMNDSKSHWLGLRGKLKKYDVRLGTASAQDYVHDPKHLSFAISRYKFAAKMLYGLEHVIEVGCGDAFGAPLVAEVVRDLTCTDIDEEQLSDDRNRLAVFKNITFEYYDFREKPHPKKADGIYLVDVIEHIFPEEEDGFLRNLVASLNPNGFVLMGTPNASSEAYASPNSRVGHVNWKSGEQMRALGQRHFHNVFMFGMNDEVVHTGYAPMCHYIWSLAVGPRSSYVGSCCCE